MTIKIQRWNDLLPNKLAKSKFDAVAKDDLAALETELEAARGALGEFEEHEKWTHLEMEKIVGNKDSFIVLTKKLQAENERLKTCTRCAYCGKEFPLDTVTADQVGEHIRVCSKHPLRRAEAENERLKKRVDGLKDKLDFHGIPTPKEQPK